MIGKKRRQKGKTRKKLAEVEAKLKRALADYDNLEKRVICQREEFVRFAKVEILDKLINVLDDLERAELHLKNKGLTMVLGQFRAVLSSEGVKEIEANKKDFDPEKMDCVGMVAGPKNQVINIIQKGYLLGDRVIRPAKVEVGKGEGNIS